MTIAFEPMPGAAEEAASLVALLECLRQQSYAFTTISPASHALVNSRPGNQTARDIRGVFGWSRPFAPDVVGEALFALMGRAGALEQDGHLWRSRFRVSSLAGQLFLHSAFPTTQGDAIFFGPDTYRFARAIERHLTRARVRVYRAVDIGSGSGAGAIMLAQRLPQAEVYGVDINDQALALAAINGIAAGLFNLHWLHSDLLQALDGEFDLIISNPPFLVDAAGRAYRHGGGPLGAELSLNIVDTALARLAPGGSLLLYTGVAVMDGQDLFLREVQARLQDRGWHYEYEEMDPDIFGEELGNPVYAHADRIAAVVLTVQRPG
ncbi:methyltransferase [Methylobacillus flagellatus]|uniref:Methyltransferase small n=1 Tax=Methylobacillus flagellatus (strain ATCC 51484 / DSM 6875 / VKM B-1610 / KT) TaxID=265072 RepID=Q1H1E4_METFK|nr:class I SAM-dependent methyltransferase [Methylobacillus flagellatus]ABE49693.1 methyltransferase small [Methylobacillus flagellatus KT]